MAREPDVDEIAAALRVNLGLLRRRLRQTTTGDEITMPEISALARLDHSGPTTATALARLEQISPQSMGATLATLESRRLVARAPDPDDGRRAVVSISDAGLEVLRHRRTEKTEQLARALASGFTRAELEQLAAAAPLLERLAQNL
jgi:DNA-binding MarR family transcriptional regulator